MSITGSIISDHFLTVKVKRSDNGLPIGNFKFIINENNIGNPFDPDPNNWPSLRAGASHSPVVAIGDNTSPTIAVPQGSYLVSVLAPGYKLGGRHITVNSNVSVTVNLIPAPLPLAKIRVHVFNDNSPVNGEDDFPLEVGLPGFQVIIEDTVGEVTTDYFGNVLGTQYEKDAAGNYIFDVGGKPIPIPNTGGNIWSDANGNAVIENLAPGKYGVQVIPPDGTDWIQTTTIEGTPVIDAWIEEGNQGYMYEEGFISPLVFIGFVKPMEFPAPAPGEQTGTITTQIVTVVEWDQQPPTLVLGDPVERPWVALTDIGGNDNQVFTGRGDINGKITIANVPAGLYQIAVWDEPLDYVISFRTVQVPDPNTGSWNVIVEDDPAQAPGQINVPRWFGWITGKVFRDINGNGVFEPGLGEEGIPNVEVGTRFKDGSIQYSTITDLNGNYMLKEVFELEHFTVAEVGFTRFGRTAAVATPDYDVPGQGPTTIYNGDLTLASMTSAGSKNKIDWGKKEYPVSSPGGGEITNGGISGIVYYATMRNELNPRVAMAEDYEPGIPHVVMNLYATSVDSVTNEIIRGPKINSVTTDAWEHPVRPDGKPVPEIPVTGNYIARGVFDGGYAFEDKWVLDSGGNPMPDPGNPGEYLTELLIEGTYIVEVEVPPGYKILDEFSVNTSKGDSFIPSPDTTVLMAPPPYDGTSRTAKVVALGWGLNAAADFFLYTDVPIPGWIVGLLSDDLNLQTDPQSLFFGEKRNIPLTPIGIRDFTGRLITTVYSDPNGAFEVILPSTYTANVPSPSGISPGMYRVVGNDPGDPGAPNANYNPDYQTLSLVFDVWPGKTTYADVALLPITGYVEEPTEDFTQPPMVQVNPGTPQIQQVNRVYIPATGSRTLIIKGTDFGNNFGFVTVDNRFLPINRWRNNRIEVIVPRNFPAGAWQLLVYRSNGKVTPTGLTIHVFGTGYNPTVVTVSPGGSIQSAIDGAPEKSLIVIRPGTYNENPILYKNIKLQGYGPQVTKIDGRFFSNHRKHWLNKLAGIQFDGNQAISTGQTITVVAKSGKFSSSFRTQIDGFSITGARGTEAGGIYVNAYCHHLQIGNNVIQSNGGGFGGGITIGKAYIGDNHNDHIRIHHNRIISNGGVSLAGAIGIFNGADHYEIDHNQIAGNYSAEYGGGISHFGLSRFGRIHHNYVFFNGSFDEGAGIFIGGEEPKPPALLSAGSGEVQIYNNSIMGNVANDDGGGIRLLQPGTYSILIYNNVVVNNVSTDLGGGIALDDASNVIIYNNTIAKNITTATAEDSDKQPHAAGLASEGNSTAFQESLPTGSPTFSNPVMFNNIFWDNRAHHFDLNTGKLSTDYELIDLEVFGTSTPRNMTPNYCYLTRSYGSGTHNIIYNGTNPPSFVQEYHTKLDVVVFGPQPDFKTVKIIITPGAKGDYHLRSKSPVINKGTRTFTAHGVTWEAPVFDIDGATRPRHRVDMGADEYWPIRLSPPLLLLFRTVIDILKKKGIKFPYPYPEQIPVDVLVALAKYLKRGEPNGHN